MYEANGPDPGAVADLLRLCAQETDASTSPGFLEGYRDAADAAKAMHSLRQSARRIGFEPLPFSQYVERIAFAAGAAIDLVLRYLGISSSGDTSQLDSAQPGVVRLAVALGVPLRELLVHLRLGGLIQAGVPAVPVAPRRGAAATRGAFVSANVAVL